MLEQDCERLVIIECRTGSRRRSVCSLSLSGERHGLGCDPSLIAVLNSPSPPFSLSAPISVVIKPPFSPSTPSSDAIKAR